MAAKSFHEHYRPKQHTPANVHIHDRMPLVLKPEDFNVWVDPSTPRSHVQAIIADSHKDFISYRVSTKVNNTRNDFPELLASLKA